MKIRNALIILAACVANIATAQTVAVKSNLLSAVQGTLNGSLELAISQRTTLNLYGSVRPWSRSESDVYKYWLIEPEYRYYTCSKFNGFFVGVLADVARFNVGGRDMPFDMCKFLKSHRYEGTILGGGVEVGYEWLLGKHWNLETSVSLGYEHVKYDEYDSPLRCAPQTDSGNYNYFGPTKGSISLMYVF